MGVVLEQGSPGGGGAASDNLLSAEDEKHLVPSARKSPDGSDGEPLLKAARVGPAAGEASNDDNYGKLDANEGGVEADSTAKGENKKDHGKKEKKQDGKDKKAKKDKKKDKTGLKVATKSAAGSAAKQGGDSAQHELDLRRLFKEGQKQLTPPVADATRAFYESLLKEKPDSKIAIRFCVEYGVLPLEQHKKLLKRYYALKEKGAFSVQQQIAKAIQKMDKDGGKKDKKDGSNKEKKEKKKKEGKEGSGKEKKEKKEEGEKGASGDRN